MTMVMKCKSIVASGQFQYVEHQGMCMAKKTMMGEAADAVKSVAGAALGAAAAAATGVVVGTLASAITRGGRKLGEAAPVLEKAAADKVSKPMLPTPKR